MSDFDEYGGDNGGVSQGDFIMDLLQSGITGGRTPGKTPANQLSYLKSFMDMLGVPIEAMYGANPRGNEFHSNQRDIFGTLYGDVYNAIDGGADPVSALQTAGLDATPEGEAYKSAVQYATDKAEYKEKNVDWGSKTEYEVMGQPTEKDLVNQIAMNRLKRNSWGIPIPSVMSGREKNAAVMAARKRITQAKGTQVRSDAQQNLIRNLLAYQTMLGA